MNSNSQNTTSPDVSEHAGLEPQSMDQTTARLRIRRIDDLQQEALAKADALDANLGVASGDLLRRAMELEKLLNQVLETTAEPTARLELVTAVADRQLKLLRLVNHFAKRESGNVAMLRSTNGSRPR